MPTCHNCDCYIGGPVKGRRERVPGSHPAEFVHVHRRPAMCKRLGALRQAILEEHSQGKDSVAKARRQPAPGLGVTVYELAFPDGHESAVLAYGPARETVRDDGRRSGLGRVFGGLVGALWGGRQRPEPVIVHSGEAGGPRRPGAPTRRQAPNPRHRGRRGRGRMKGRRG